MMICHCEKHNSEISSSFFYKLIIKYDLSYRKSIPIFKYKWCNIFLLYVVTLAYQRLIYNVAAVPGAHRHLKQKYISGRTN